MSNRGEVPEIIGLDGPNEAKAVIDTAREKDVNLIVAAGSDPSGKKGGSLATNPLLKQSPFTTVILFGGSARSTRPQKVLVGATENANDVSSVFLAYQMADSLQTSVTLARSEFEAGLEGAEIGRRDLEQLRRDSGVQGRDDVQSQVFQSGEVEQAAQAMNENDLVMFGANFEHLAAYVELTEKPTIAVVKRQPPLRRWQAGTQQISVWSTRLSPADYAELIQGLRQGSKLGSDFVTMLSLATVVASLGLLQDSAAVVIGSMLLAPLMTPMIGCGLALAQANSKLGYMALKTVAVGLICTLALSYLIGVFTPGEELTSQIYARGQPTILDLFIAVASAAAASYALARPNLVGSIAGVAIATALVPPALFGRDINRVQRLRQRPGRCAAVRDEFLRHRPGCRLDLPPYWGQLQAGRHAAEILGLPHRRHFQHRHHRHRLPLAKSDAGESRSGEASTQGLSPGQVGNGRYRGATHLQPGVRTHHRGSTFLPLFNLGRDTRPEHLGRSRAGILRKPEGADKRTDA